MSDSDRPSLCSWKAFSQLAHADQCVLVPIPQTPREVTSLRNAALFKECCCHRSFIDGETLFNSELQHNVKDS